MTRESVGVLAAKAEAMPKGRTPRLPMRLPLVRDLLLIFRLNTMNGQEAFRRFAQQLQRAGSSVCAVRPSTALGDREAYCESVLCVRYVERAPERGSQGVRER